MRNLLSEIQSNFVDEKYTFKKCAFGKNALKIYTFGTYTFRKYTHTLLLPFMAIWPDGFIYIPEKSNQNLGLKGSPDSQRLFFSRKLQGGEEVGGSFPIQSFVADFFL